MPIKVGSSTRGRFSVDFPLIELEINRLLIALLVRLNINERRRSGSDSILKQGYNESLRVIILSNSINALTRFFAASVSYLISVFQK